MIWERMMNVCWERLMVDLHINGECNAGVTLQTALNPIIPAKAKVVKRFMKPGPVSLPSTKAVPTPPVVKEIERTCSCHGVKATIGSSTFSIYDESALP